MSAPHYVDRERLDATYYCGECGEEVQGDGDGFWHRDETLNPRDEDATPSHDPAVTEEPG